MTHAFGLDVAELTNLFETFGEINESVDILEHTGVAFVKFSSRAAAKNAVAASPICHLQREIFVQFLDLNRQSKNAAWNREQERRLMANELRFEARHLRPPSIKVSSPSHTAHAAEVTILSAYICDSLC